MATVEERPRIVGWLAYGGLLPFLILAVLTITDRGRGMVWQGYLAAYGAVILSFIGALHWGFAMGFGGLAPSRRNALFAWSVIPSLIGFAALILHSALGDGVLLIGYAVHYAQDRRLASTVPLPAWYLPLRLPLTAVAMLCIAAGAFVGSWT